MNDVPSRLLRPIIGARSERLQGRAARCASVPLLVLLVGAQPAHGDIFKCTTRKSMPTYQNFPCEFDSLGAMPVTAPVPKAGVPAAQNAENSRLPVRPAATAPRVGMTTNEVKAIWGEPLDTTREEFAKGNIETWTYANSRSIRFDLKGRVTEIR